MNTRFKVGIVGAGYVAAHHLRALRDQIEVAGMREVADVEDALDVLPHRSLELHHHSQSDTGFIFSQVWAEACGSCHASKSRCG